ncbi:hypothetical protein SAMN05216218_107127 [Halorientalis regularis]|jgi:hypothetical protein|uniref:Uncharacterized protein n=1 Tax=Halorientalis regularis TaxID=660518 RepID=A0A1G7M4B8_9EURY|nr:hypothetical protein SAMN05216218_107127 [Halorientalis regularis]
MAVGPPVAVGAENATATTTAATPEGTVVGLWVTDAECASLGLVVGLVAVTLLVCGIRMQWRG